METNPLPRKHTLWQAASNFRSAQASVHRVGRNMDNQWETRIIALELNQEEFGHDIREIKEQIARLTKMVESLSKAWKGFPEGLSSTPKQLSVDNRVEALEHSQDELNRRMIEQFSQLSNVIEGLVKNKEELAQKSSSPSMPPDQNEPSIPNQKIPVKVDNQGNKDPDIEKSLEVTTQMARLGELIFQEEPHSLPIVCIKSDFCRCLACKEKDSDQIWEKVMKWAKPVRLILEKKHLDPVQCSQATSGIGTCSNDNARLSLETAGKKPLGTTSYLQHDPTLGSCPLPANYLPRLAFVTPCLSSCPHPATLQPPSGQVSIHAAKNNQKILKHNSKKIEYDLIPMSYGELYSHLLRDRLVTPAYTRPMKPPYPKWYDVNASCEYHAGIRGHSIEDCIALKRRVQNLIDMEILRFDSGNGSGSAGNPPFDGTEDMAI